MEGCLIKITPDKEKAKSILKMVDTTIEMIKIVDIDKFSSNVTKEYYSIKIRNDKHLNFLSEFLFKLYGGVIEK